MCFSHTTILGVCLVDVNPCWRRKEKGFRHGDYPTSLSKLELHAMPWKLADMVAPSQIKS
jgi:hypothetical protein